MLTRVVAVLLACTVLCGPVAAAAAGEEQGSQDNALLLVMDASGSMKESAGGGQTRIAAAKDALTDLVGELPAGARVGLRVYGATQDQGCDDTKLFVPVSPLHPAKMKRTIRSFSPRGDTPIGPSLRAAAEDLRAVDADTKTVVLVSDGEDTCSPPTPCQVARDIAASGVRLRVESIGFQVDAAARRQLECIAKATGGTYHDAPDPQTLSAQLRALSLRAFRGYQATGAPVTGTPSEQRAPTLRPGAYLDSLAPGESKHYVIEVPEGGLPVVNAALIAGATQPRLGSPENLRVQVRTPNGQECAFGSVSETSSTFSLDATAVGGRATGGQDCAAPGTRIVEVERQLDGGDGVNSLELLYTLVPPVSPNGEPAPPARPAPSGGSAKNPDRVRGGTSYDSAPRLGEGVWSDTIRLTETLYYRVPVDWGQRLRVRATFRGLTTGRGREGFLQPVVEVRDALRVDPGSREIVQITSPQPRSARIATDPVRPPSGGEVAPFRMAGDHYVLINAADYLGGSANAAAAAVELEIDVVGKPEAGPAFADLATVGEEPATTAPNTGVPGTSSAGGGAGDDGAAADEDQPAAMSTWVLPVLALAGAAVLVMVVVLVLRRRAATGR